jgi:hypothetical protein
MLAGHKEEIVMQEMTRSLYGTMLSAACLLQ